MGFEALRHQGDLRASIRRRRIRAAAWAASLVLAVGTGWAAAAMSRQEPSRPVARAPQPSPSQPTVAVVETTPANSLDSDLPAMPSPRPHHAERAAPPAERAESTQPANRDVADLQAKLALLDVSAPVQLAPIEPGADRAAESGGMWRTMSWDGARNETGDELPHIEGLPVIRVQVQATDHGRRPLMVVAQQLASGQVIETIEGPANDVSQFLSRRGEGATALAPGEVGLPTAADQSMAMQVGGDRMLAVTGALPPDSLRAMIRRINAEMRK
jgi:hypothetical protein